MSNEVAKLRQTEVAPSSPTTIASSNAVEAIMDGLKQAITHMGADDISVDLSAHQEGNRSSANFRIRAYKHRKLVMSRDEDHLERE